MPRSSSAEYILPVAAPPHEELPLMSGALALGAFMQVESVVPPGLLAQLHELDMRTYEHMLRTAALNYGVLVESGAICRLSDEQVLRLVVGGGLHDLGKYRKNILPVIQLDTDYTPDQRALVAQHAPAGSEDLLAMALNMVSIDPYAAQTLVVAAEVADDHHKYGLPFPKAGSGHAQFAWAATILAQCTERPDALTDKTRTYMRARMTREGVYDPCTIMSSNLEREFGTDRFERLPILGVSPVEIVGLAFEIKQSEFPEHFTGNILDAAVTTA